MYFVIIIRLVNVVKMMIPDIFIMTKYKWQCDNMKGVTCVNEPAERPSALRSFDFQLVV